MSKFSKYFNSTTNTGRANVAKATYASLAALYLFSRFRKRGQKTEDAHSELKDDHKDDLIAKGLPQDSHHHAQDSKTEPEPTCPCKCNENAKATNGNGQHNDKGHNGENGHHSNNGHHNGHSADDSHSNPSNPSNNGNHGHHNGAKDEQPGNDHHNTHGKSVDKVNYDQSKFLETSNPVGVDVKDENDPQSNGKASEKSFFSYMSDSVITWGLP